MFANLLVLLLPATFATTHCESERDVSSREFQRFEPNCSVILGPASGRTRSELECGVRCHRSSACKAFCYSWSTALCYPYPSIPPASAEPSPTQHAEVKCFADCPVASGYRIYGTRCIKAHTHNATWHDAKATCEQDGGHLYYFKTLQEDKQPIVLLTDALRDLGGFWVGANDLTTEGVFVWGNTSTAVDADLWASGEPNGFIWPDEDCAVFAPFTLLLRDRDCALSRDFVCQIDV